MLFYIIYIPIVLPVQICSMLFKYAACCSDMQHVVQICSMLFRYAACCSDMQHVVQRFVIYLIHSTLHFPPFFLSMYMNDFKYMS